MQTKRIVYLVFLFLICIVSPGMPQLKPDYAERSFFTTIDSSAVQYASTIGSDGELDPAVYLLGPGDRLFVSVNGVTEFSNVVTVDFQGSIYIPNVGGVQIGSLSLNEASKKIEQLIFGVYRNVKVFVSLVDVRKVRVGLFGDVVKPSSYTLFANSRLLDVLNLAGGIQPTADMRNIVIQSKTGAEKKYDIVSFIRTGDRSQNPYLSEGDRIYVDRTDKTVSIFGAVKFPATYEFREGETVPELIDIAGGFLAKSKTDTIEVVSFLSDNKTMASKFYLLAELKSKKIVLNDGDKVIVREFPGYKIDDLIIIKGFVRYPGYYKIKDRETTLREVISHAGGFLPNASLRNSTLVRSTGEKTVDAEYERLKLMLRADMTDDEYDYFKSKSRLKTGKVVVDFEALFQSGDLSEDVQLRRNDVIEVPEKKEYVTIIGQVVTPGNIPYVSSYLVMDYIRLAGGFGWRAVEGDVRVIRASTGEWVDAEDVTELKPGDTIWVPEDPPSPHFWDVFKDSLYIIGQLATVIAATVAVIVSMR